jgi:hypothetical protein
MSRENENTLPGSWHSLGAACTISIIASFLIFPSCQKENAVYESSFTIFNSVPGSNGFQLLANGQKLPAVYNYGAPTAEQTLPSFTGSFGWAKSGTTRADSTFKTDLPNGSSFTLVFYDSLARYKTSIVKNIFFDEDSKNKCGIRVFAATINASNLTITNDTGKVLLGNMQFADFAGATENPFSETDTSGGTILRMYHNNLLLDSIKGVKLEHGKSYSLFTSGIINGSGTWRPRLYIQAH